MENQGFSTREKLPNSQASLILGIIGIVCSTILSCCYGFVPGLVLGILALVYGNGAKKLYNSEPGRYEEKDAGNARTGVVLGWLSIIFSALMFVLIIIVFAVFGMDAADPDFWKEYQRKH